MIVQFAAMISIVSSVATVDMQVGGLLRNITTSTVGKYHLTLRRTFKRVACVCQVRSADSRDICMAYFKDFSVTVETRKHLSKRKKPTWIDLTPISEPFSVQCQGVIK